MSFTSDADTSIPVQELGAVTLPRSASFSLRSKTIDQDFQIDVAWPPVPPAAGQKWPVIYVLDGNHTFPLAAQIARTLQTGPFPLPPTLVVGIGYRFERPEDQARWGGLRVRDFSPCSDRLLEETYRDLPMQCGGAADFLTFIETELKPFIADRYPVDPDDQTLVGMSLGGLFVLFTLFTSPAAFNRYIALSPAIYWGDRRLFDVEARLAKQVQDLPVHLFLSAGALEEAHDVRQKFVSNVYELEARLRQRAYPGLRMGMHIFEGETHMSVMGAAVSRGLAEVFGGHRDMSDWSRWLKT